ncbi:MAG: VOC family protein [Phycisphaerae bacterium]|jgi:predicted enzyme related to lactoylglutathione lyase|nr:VOC family protein [Phycisphaerae bacterium]
MLQGVEHLALCAESIPDLIAWYQRLLQVDLVKEGSDGPFFLKFPDGFLLELIDAAGDVPAIPRDKEKGFRHIALTVSSLETMAGDLKDQGVEVVEDIKTVPNGTKLFLFRDIEGNIIQLVERKQALQA